jgi:hypothetical protein
MPFSASGQAIKITHNRELTLMLVADVSGSGLFGADGGGWGRNGSQSLAYKERQRQNHRLRAKSIA